MRHTNSMTAPELMIDDLHWAALEHIDALAKIMKLIQHTTDPKKANHSKTCHDCTKLALRLQKHQAKIANDCLAVTTAIENHYPRG